MYTLGFFVVFFCCCCFFVVCGVFFDGFWFVCCWFFVVVVLFWWGVLGFFLVCVFFLGGLYVFYCYFCSLNRSVLCDSLFLSVVNVKTCYHLLSSNFQRLGITTKPSRRISEFIH